MILTNEQIQKAKMANNAEDLLSIAQENGITLTEEEAGKYFSQLQTEEELSGEELSNVSGGCKGILYKKPERVGVVYGGRGDPLCPFCRGRMGVVGGTLYDDAGDAYNLFECENGHFCRHYWNGDFWTKNS